MLQKTSKTNPRTTLKEVARLAGVSVSTASFVLSGRSEERRISTEASERVRSVAAQNGYIPNLLVRSMQKGRTHILSFFNAFGYRALNDLYMNSISAAVEFAAQERGYDVLIHSSRGRSADEIFHLLAGGFTDGLIFFGTPDNSELLDLLRGCRLPTVLLNHADTMGVLPYVTDDFRDGMRQIADRLVGLGHRQIAAFDGFPGSDGPARIAALREALAVHGVALPESRVVPVHYPFRSPDEGLQMIQNSPDGPPTALFCWHDRLGYETLEACDRLGISVPRDLSLIGYDGLRWPSSSPHILTSVRIALEEATAEAIRLLDDLIEGRHSAAPAQCYSVTLIEGTTLTAPSP